MTRRVPPNANAIPQYVKRAKALAKAASEKLLRLSRRCLAFHDDNNKPRGHASRNQRAGLGAGLRAGTGNWGDR